MGTRIVERLQSNQSAIFHKLTTDETRPDFLAVERRPVLIESLIPADSPRTEGIDQNHVDVLNELEVHLPPIVVHRPTWRVVDGMHRLDAARRRGETTIDACVLDLAEHEVFALSVRLNTVHGMPLSYSDRVAAAGRLLRENPEMSDRYVASIASLSARTVARVRRSTGEDPRLNVRIGRDGKARPKGVAQGREHAGRLLTERPDANLREVARAAGISLGTAHDVKTRLQRGQDPVPSGSRSVAAEQQPARRASRSAPEMLPLPPAELLNRLRRDPALRSTEPGRLMLRLLAMHDLTTTEWTSMVINLPTHCSDAVATLARQCALKWTEFADQMEQGAMAGLPPPGT
jgi:ParB-like chromosome segregation protein Spo0J